MADQKMTVTRLIHQYYLKHPEGHFFDRETLKFFGERISDMRVMKDTEVVTDYAGEKHTCYCLSHLQRKHPCGPTRRYTYFDVDTLDKIKD